MQEEIFLDLVMQRDCGLRLERVGVFRGGLGRFVPGAGCTGEAILHGAHGRICIDI
jgi:hypothetical protein